MKIVAQTDSDAVARLRNSSAFNDSFRTLYKTTDSIIVLNKKLAVQIKAVENTVRTQRLLVSVLAILVSVIAFRHLKKNRKSEFVVSNLSDANTSSTVRSKEQAEGTPGAAIALASPPASDIKTDAQPEPSVITNEKSGSVVDTKQFVGTANKESSRVSWLVTGASAIGKSHVSGGVPCQDNHYWETLEENWGIAILCDGAGSAPFSHIGSDFIARKAAPEIFKSSLTTQRWFMQNEMPTDEEWNFIAVENIRLLQQMLNDFAVHEQHPIATLACTFIVAIYAENGLLMAHVGDGRAGFCNPNGEWKSIMTPHKGEESNQTIFLTSNLRWKDPDFRMSGVCVPETRVIRENPLAFTLMSDGCEAHSFECSKIDKNSGKWSDPNLPFPGFFNPLVSSLNKMQLDNLSPEEIHEKWENFLAAGTQGLRNEPDDKTMILGIAI